MENAYSVKKYCDSVTTGAPMGMWTGDESTPSFGSHLNPIPILYWCPNKFWKPKARLYQIDFFIHFALSFYRKNIKLLTFLLKLPNHNGKSIKSLGTGTNYDEIIYMLYRVFRQFRYPVILKSTYFRFCRPEDCFPLLFFNFAFLCTAKCRAVII